MAVLLPRPINMATMKIDWVPSGETFSLLGHVFDVDAAKAILAAKKTLKMERLEVADVADFVGSPGSFTMGLSVDWDRVKSDPALLPRRQGASECP